MATTVRQRLTGRAVVRDREEEHRAAPIAPVTPIKAVAPAPAKKAPAKKAPAKKAVKKAAKKAPAKKAPAKRGRS